MKKIKITFPLISIPQSVGTLFLFNVTDAQLSYYIKPFEEYLFYDEGSNPTTGFLIQLDYKAVLRMLLLLKDEYRVDE